MMTNCNIYVFVLAFFAAANLFAGHPLITDDTETQGSRNLQIEFTPEYERYTECSAAEIPLTLTYGIFDNADFVVGIPYIFAGFSEETSMNYGFSDISFEVKWNFYKTEGLNFALKPGFGIPTGDHKQGLGCGDFTYSLFFITSYHYEPVTLHFNAGYLSNENRIHERVRLWHISLAAEFDLNDRFKAVMNLAADRNAQPGNYSPPLCFVNGIVYALNENIEMDLGLKTGLNTKELRYGLLTGLTIFI